MYGTFPCLSTQSVLEGVQPFPDESWLSVHISTPPVPWYGTKNVRRSYRHLWGLLWPYIGHDPLLINSSVLSCSFCGAVWGKWSFGWVLFTHEAPRLLAKWLWLSSIMCTWHKPCSYRTQGCHLLPTQQLLPLLSCSLQCALLPLALRWKPPEHSRRFPELSGHMCIPRVWLDLFLGRCAWRF